MEIDFGAVEEKDVYFFDYLGTVLRCEELRGYYYKDSFVLNHKLGFKGDLETMKFDKQEIPVPKVQGNLFKMKESEFESLRPKLVTDKYKLVTVTAVLNVAEGVDAKTLVVK